MPILRHSRVYNSHQILLQKHVTLVEPKRTVAVGGKNLPDINLNVASSVTDDQLTTAANYANTVSPYESHEGDVPSRLRNTSAKDYFYNPNFPDIPWWILTTFRFLQILTIITSLCFVFDNQNQPILQYWETFSYLWLSLALAVHITVWLIEENVVRTLKTRATTYFGMTCVACIYMVCCSYNVIFIYAHFPMPEVYLAIVLVSLMYWGYHLHWTMKSANSIKNLQRLQEMDFKKILDFKNATRPECLETRLQVGPQLTFPKPEEYSIPKVYVGKST